MWDDQFEEILRPFLPFLPPQEPLTADHELKDLGLDSLGTVQLLGLLEEAYQVRFRDSALTMDTFRSAGVLWETVEGMLQRATS
ncbi:MULTISPECIES: phosphopantetheine-binding protein [unclassified Streptomyces]|uniref:Phosphopantetheine-binding protein n=2 Tax=Streptomyces TaxID=1883 RepID=A0ABU2RHU5_9ACTN|nr:MULTISPECIES: phosphopantetheine-binding protein [unclassified Streptomyces]HBF80975.1 phosphopantetheine-binding protein [Streptomyces sp.]AEN13361.1 phosphopantetheine-binding protein [Streptomyces sp. SirexAA-E]MBK3592453.1 acyl carrier protein [Streptomyces sp. MBT51]MDT0427048.1 phosphopantetheine-binding protein [Streptomyces sp. DSM 41770]MYR65191.1 acyl carrier protein [Streptomyces sp. SID4939]